MTAVHDYQNVPPLARLSEIDRRILRLVAAGRTSKEIARELDRSPLTIDSRLKDVCQRLGADTRAQAASMLLVEEAASAPPDLGGPPTRGIEPLARGHLGIREDGGPRGKGGISTRLSDLRLTQIAMRIVLILVAVATAAFLLASAIAAIQGVFLTVLRG